MISKKFQAYFLFNHKPLNQEDKMSELIEYRVYEPNGIVFIKTSSEEDLLSNLQKAVDGFIEVVRQEKLSLPIPNFANISEDEILIVNENFLLRDFNPNFYFNNELHGNVVAIKDSDLK